MAERSHLLAEINTQEINIRTNAVAAVDGMVDAPMVCGPPAIFANGYTPRSRDAVDAVVVENGMNERRRRWKKSRQGGHGRGIDSDILRLDRRLPFSPSASKRW